MDGWTDRGTDGYRQYGKHTGYYPTIIEYESWMTKVQHRWTLH